MIQDKLKKIIFKKLYKDLSNAEIIPYQNNIWFIDREKKYWYLEYKRIGDLWWRHDFFENFFFMFSLKRTKYEPLICEWVEEVLNRKVITPAAPLLRRCGEVEKVLNYKVITPVLKSHRSPVLVEEVLNCKVITPRDFPFTNRSEVDEVLNYKVTAPTPAIAIPDERVDEVLNCKVITSVGTSIAFYGTMEEVLNN